MSKRRKVVTDSSLSDEKTIQNSPLFEILSDELLAIIIEFIGNENIINYMLINSRFNRIINDDQYDCFQHFEYEIPFIENPPSNCNLIRKLLISSIDEEIYDFDEEIVICKFCKVNELIVMEENEDSFDSVCKVVDPLRVKKLSINFSVNSEILKQITKNFINLETLFISDHDSEINLEEIEKKLSKLSNFKLREDLDYSGHHYDQMDVEEICKFLSKFAPNLKKLEFEPRVAFMKLESLIELCTKLELLEFAEIGVQLKCLEIEKLPSLQVLMKRNLKLHLNCYSKAAVECLKRYFENYQSQITISLIEDQENIQNE